MAKAANAKEVFDNLCSQFKPEKAPNEKAVFVFDLSGEGGSKYWSKIDNGTCDAGEGPLPAGLTADITVLATAADFVALVNGEINPMMGFMQGKFKVQGNMGIALKMMTWFNLA